MKFFTIKYYVANMFSSVKNHKIYICKKTVSMHLNGLLLFKLASNPHVHVFACVYCL